MALYSYSEFRELCGVSDAYISVNVGRGKIIYSDGKKVDTKNQINQDFLNKMLQKKELRKSGAIKKVKLTPNKGTRQKKTNGPETKKNKISEQVPIDVAPISAPSTTRNEDGSLPNNDALLTLEKKKLEIEQKEILIRISLLNEAKLRGENIPMDEVKTMIRELSVSFINNYKDSFEKMIIEMCFRNKINQVEEGKIKSEFITILNDTHKRVFEDVKHNLDKIKRNSVNNVQLDKGSK